MPQRCTSLGSSAQPKSPQLRAGSDADACYAEAVSDAIVIPVPAVCIQRTAGSPGPQIVSIKK